MSLASFTWIEVQHQMQRQSGEFRLWQATVGPGYKVPKHSHESAAFFIVLQGSMTEAYERRSRDCKPLSVVYTRPDEMHSNSYHNAGGRLFALELNPQSLERVRECAVTLDESAYFDGGVLTWLMIRLYNESLQQDGVSPLVIEGLALEIMAEASRRPINVNGRQRPHWVKQAKELLHEHFAENLTLSGVAESVGIHPVHLARVFRQIHRCTIGEYVRKLRIEFVSRQLSTSDTPLVEIASAAGFSDQGHFSRTFKQHTGLTPGQFRNLFPLR